MATICTDAYKREIHAAMEKAGGKTAEAARALGITTEELSRHIHHHDDLKYRWATKYKEIQPPPQAVIEMHRPQIQRLKGQEAAEALEIEDRKLRLNCARVGIEGKALELYLSLGAFQRDQYGSKTLDMMAGGINKQFLETLVEVSKINDRLSSDWREMDMEEEQMLREDRSRQQAHLVQLYDKAVQAMLVLAKVQAMKSEKDGGPKSNKPGFSPLLIRADGDIHVQEIREVRSEVKHEPPPEQG
jgi:hypothetical protein